MVGATLARIGVAGVVLLGGGIAWQQLSMAGLPGVVEFQRAADAYSFLHRQVERRVGLTHRHDGNSNPVEAAELAPLIVAERKSAVEGALFTTSAAAAFRLLAAQAARDAACDPGELKTGVWETTHAVNGPATGTRPVSACIVAALPGLPAELAYRSSGNVLVLVDTHANLVVDRLPALLPAGGGR